MLIADSHLIRHRNDRRHDLRSILRKGHEMSKTRKWAVAAVTLGTSAALLIGGASVASAHDRGDKSGGRGPISTLVTDGTLTKAQATAIHEALKAERSSDREAREAEMAAARDAVLAELVTKGTLTQAQADAIKAADRGGMRELIAGGTVTRTDLAAVRDALKADRAENKAAHEAERKADRDAALAALVTKGTLTQAQADAIAAAIDAAPARDGKGGKGHGGKGGPRG
jgi:Spy/CpxP family protein refolding chaperone